jgi:hypothetical protein
MSWPPSFRRWKSYACGLRGLAWEVECVAVLVPARGIPRVSSSRCPSSNVNLWRLVGPKMWPNREFAAC